MGPTEFQNREHKLKKYKCEHCAYRANSKARVGQHMRVHSDKRPFACSFAGCSFRTKYPQCLEDHEPRHDPALSTRHKCPICSKGFCMPYQLDRHVRVHTQEKLKKCSECDFKAVNATGLISHKKKVHGVGKVGKRFQASKYKAASSVHVKVEFKEHSLQDGTIEYKCLFSGCDYTTRTKSCILVHRKVVHNPLHIVCTFPDCGMNFKSSHLYKRHMKTHDPSRPRNCSCPLCCKKLLDAAGLNRHVRTHTGERAYQCPFCEYDSAENCNVYRHIRQHHPNNWSAGMSIERKIKHEASSIYARFQCKFCEFFGDSEDSLLKHSVTHRRLTVNVVRIEHFSHFTARTLDPCELLIVSKLKLCRLVMHRLILWFSYRDFL